MNDVKYPELPADECSEWFIDGKRVNAFPYPSVPMAKRSPYERAYWEPKGGESGPLFTSDQMRSYADATCALRGAQKESGWRPIDGAPTDGELLLWGGRPSHAFIGCWGDYNVYNQPRITHYMPLPSAPTPEGEAK